MTLYMFSCPVFRRRCFEYYVLLLPLGMFLGCLVIVSGAFWPQDATASQTTVSDSRTEACYWKKDFSAFSRLIAGESVLQGEVPCPDPSNVDFGVSGEVSSEDDLKVTLQTLTAGYPIESMASHIALYDRHVAGLLVGIAKKESNWGKRVPRDAEGQDCFNYWGWKGVGSRGMAMGHGCFGDSEEAVRVVGNRIAQLVDQKKTSEPQALTVWKCGSSCIAHSPESVQKWIADVDMYYRKIVRQ